MMIRLFDAGLVRRLKRATRERIRQSGRKGLRGKWWKGASGSRAGWWWLWLLVNASRLIADQSGNTAQLRMYFLSGMSLALAGIALSRAHKLAQKLSADAERIVLLFYPISDEDFFAWATVRFAARTAWILALTLIVYFLTIDAPTAGGWVIRFVAPFAESFVVLAAILALLPHTAKYPKWLPLAFYAAAGILLFFPGQFELALRPLAYALPTGWIHLLLTSGLSTKWIACIILAALPLLAGLSWKLWNQGQRFYCSLQAPVPRKPMQVAERVARIPHVEPQPEDYEFDEPSETPQEAALPIQAAWQKQRLANWGAQITEYVWQRQWMQPWDWEKLPPIERAAGWLLNPRQREQAQFLLGPTPPTWSEKWKLAVIATAVAFVVMLSGVELLRFVAILAAAIAIATGLPILGGGWPATNQGRISGKYSPIFSCYPLSYWRASWTMYKLNFARTLTWLPLGLLFGVLGARAAGVPLAQGCWIAVKAILLFLMMMPILISGKFSKGTNDTTNLRLRLLPLIGFFLLIVFALLTLCAMAMFVPSLAWSLFAVAACGLVAWGTWAAYGWYFERAQVDLLRDQP
jgi:hypothetical protein